LTSPGWARPRAGAWGNQRCEVGLAHDVPGRRLSGAAQSTVVSDGTSASAIYEEVLCCRRSCATAPIPCSPADPESGPWAGAAGGLGEIAAARLGVGGAALSLFAQAPAFAATGLSFGAADVGCADRADPQSDALGIREVQPGGERVGAPAPRLGDHGGD